jgi:OOP family OmpA-OmpF porin
MKYLFLLIAICSFSTQLFAQNTYQLDGNRLIVPFDVLFETNSSTLKQESNEALNYVIAYLKDKTYISTLRIEVHSDQTLDESASQLLTEKRALSIGRWLVEHGIDCKRLICTGFGSSKPIADNKTPDGRSQNRRVSFFNAALRERAIGGMPIDGGGKVAGELCK